MFIAALLKIAGQAELGLGHWALRVTSYLPWVSHTWLSAPGCRVNQLLNCDLPYFASKTGCQVNQPSLLCILSVLELALVSGFLVD